VGVGYRWIGVNLGALVPSARREDHGMGMLVVDIVLLRTFSIRAGRSL